jgi:hypothetical protein
MAMSKAKTTTTMTKARRGIQRPISRTLVRRRVITIAKANSELDPLAMCNGLAIQLREQFKPF